MAKMYMQTGGGRNGQAAGRREKPSWNTLLRLARYLPPLKYKLIGAAICMVIVSTTSVGVGAIGMKLIDAIKPGEDIVNRPVLGIQSVA